MKKTIYIAILLLFSISVAYSCGSSRITSTQNDNKTINMKYIYFIPQEFNDIKLGYYETIENNCSPQFLINGMITLNSITINTPHKIICDMKSENLIPFIPVCAAYMISLRRGFKYHKLSAKMLHIRKLDEETVYSGEIIDKDRQYEHPEPHPRQRERERERIAKEEEAQKYNDDELNEGQAGGGYMNVNLMEYIDIPFKPGKYEVYLSFCGLESNHTIVEIIEK